MCDKRLWVIFCFAVVITGVLSWRLFCLQVLEGGAWRAQAQGQQNFFERTQGDRGDIYLNSINGAPVLVATNKKVYHAYISPRELAGEDKESLVFSFSEVLGVEDELIKERIEKNSAFEILKKNLSSEEVEKVKEIPGIHLQRDVVRNYPEGSLASHIIGFVGGEGSGQYGVEQFYESKISGRMGIREGLKSGWGFFITHDSTQKGEDVFLTIDYNIQHFTERALEEAVKRVNAVGGSVLVGDPNTGEILAIANYPDFDPNNYSNVYDSDFSVFRNKAIQETFEPGSVFKPITMVAALDKGVVKPDDEFYDSGERRIHGRVIRNYDRRSYGTVTMTEILERSINTGIVYVKDQAGNDVFLEYLQKFGLFEKTDIDLHGEVHSSNKSFLEGHDINYATASYGQGIETNMAQLFKAFAVLANGGTLVDPHVIRKEDQGDYELPRKRVISPMAATLVTEMMVSTIEHGFGSTAKIPGYHIAGKTGTAQVTWSKLGLPGKGYSDRTVQAFIGYAPAFDPQFVILVKLDQPQTRSAEVSAAPVFKEIAEYILEYKKIPHDYDSSDK